MAAASQLPLPQWLRIDQRPGGVVIMTLAKEPVNSMDKALWAALHAALKQLEADTSVNALIIASGLKRDVFTAGNDIKELYAPMSSAARYRNFWITQNAFLHDLYQTRLATVAAIRGACPAGGCMVAMCCDARLMTPDGSTGLNEVALGIPVPRYWAHIMQSLIGHRAANDLVLNGRMVGAAEAERLGLVDGLVPHEQLLAAAKKRAAALARLPNAARAATKQSLRSDFCKEWRAYYTGPEPQWGWDMLARPETVSQLEAVLQRLSGKPSKAKL